MNTAKNENQKVWRTIVTSCRPPFLLLTLVCVLLGLSTVHLGEHPVITVEAVLVLVCALAAHLSVNTLNEYYDFRSGLDLITTKTPFSGGSGALVENPYAAGHVFATAIGCTLVTLLTGSYFVSEQGMPALIIGGLGLAIIFTYTGWINKHPFACLFAPGFCFGPLMVLGSQLALLSVVTQEALVASLIPFFMVNNLLLLNQIPDRVPDKAIGRNHFPVAYGLKNTCSVYGAFALAACALILYASLSDTLPPTAIIALAPASLSILVFLRLKRAVDKEISITSLVPLLSLNTISVLTTPLVLAAGIWIL